MFLRKFLSKFGNMQPPMDQNTILKQRRPPILIPFSRSNHKLARLQHKAEHILMKNLFTKKSFALVFSLVLVLLSSFSFSSCTGIGIYSEGDGDLNVLCTTFAPFDAARNVAGECATVSILQDSGADLHNYAPTAETLDAIKQADIFIFVGGISDESWIHNAIEASGNKDLITIHLSDGVEPVHAELENDWNEHLHNNEEHSDEHSHEHGHDHAADEHIWTSPKNMITSVRAISDAFCAIDSKNQEEYQKNAENYIEKLEELDTELSEIAKNHSGSPLIFADRFPFVYLMHDYKIPYKAAFSGCSTEVNSDFNTQASLIEEVKKHQIKAILVIEGGDKSLAEAISLETGCEILSLNSMQSVKRSDILSGADYIEIMKGNIAVLREVMS